MSDMVDKICGVLLKQDVRIKRQEKMMKEHGKQLKAIRHLLEKTEYKDDSEEEDVSSNGKAVEDDQPDLFSIRRSPLYQAKIIQR